MKTQSWLWPDHNIGLRESRQLREEHNALVNSHAALVEACQSALSVLESMLPTIQRDWPDVYSPSSVKTSIDKCYAALNVARGEDQL